MLLRAQRRAALPASVSETPFRSTAELLSAVERRRIIPVPGPRKSTTFPPIPLKGSSLT